MIGSLAAVPCPVCCISFRSFSVYRVRSAIFNQEFKVLFCYVPLNYHPRKIYCRSSGLSSWCLPCFFCLFFLSYIWPRWSFAKACGEDLILSQSFAARYYLFRLWLLIWYCLDLNNNITMLGELLSRPDPDSNLPINAKIWPMDKLRTFDLSCDFGAGRAASRLFNLMPDVKTVHICLYNELSYWMHGTDLHYPLYPQISAQHNHTPNRRWVKYRPEREILDCSAYLIWRIERPGRCHLMVNSATSPKLSESEMP